MKTAVIVGLGNPGREYQRTRHNVGFRCVDALAEHWGIKLSRQRARAVVGEGDARGYRVILAEPQTFMNNSGESVRGLLKMSNLTRKDLLVIADDLDLPFGRLRLRDRGSSGGQRGIQSIINHLGTDQFARLRIGIGRPPVGIDPVDYVLDPFSAAEAAELTIILERAVVGIETMLDHGIASAMNLLNIPPKALIPPSMDPPELNR